MSMLIFKRPFVACQFPKDNMSFFFKNSTWVLGLGSIYHKSTLTNDTFASSILRV